MGRNGTDEARCRSSKTSMASVCASRWGEASSRTDARHVFYRFRRAATNQAVESRAHLQCTRSPAREPQGPNERILRRVLGEPRHPHTRGCETRGVTLKAQDGGDPKIESAHGGAAAAQGRRVPSGRRTAAAMGPPQPKGSPEVAAAMGPSQPMGSPPTMRSRRSRGATQPMRPLGHRSGGPAGSCWQRSPRRTGPRRGTPSRPSGRISRSTSVARGAAPSARRHVAEGLRASSHHGSHAHVSGRSAVVGRPRFQENSPTRFVRRARQKRARPHKG